MRIGQGYDAHKIIPGSGVVLGGIEIECDYSIVAYSDGDIIIHALIDALFGAAAYGDLGDFFPTGDESIKGISGKEMLLATKKKLYKDDYRILNIDITYVGEVPKIMPYREKIRSNIASLLEVELDRISCKATTTDGLGFEGRLEGISCNCIALLTR